MTAAVEVIHRLHGQQHGELLARLVLGDREAELQLAAARDHVLEDLVDRVLVDPGPARRPRAAPGGGCATGTAPR